MLQCYPCYDNPDAWEIDDLVDAVSDGLIMDFIFNMLSQKDKMPLGTFSMPVTKPVNGITVDIMVDLNKIDDDKGMYKMRVNDAGDGFMDVMTDIDSIQMVVSAIKNNTMPLHNVTKNIDPCEHPYIIL